MPCNGLDKTAGSIAREIALQMAEKWDCPTICPMFFRVNAGKYNEIIGALPLLVIDGCASRCASKMAVENELIINQKIVVVDEAKKCGCEIGSGLRLAENDLQLCQQIIQNIFARDLPVEETSSEVIQEKSIYDIYRKDKYIFRVPKEGFYFNRHDCWAYVVGGKARIGVTDYVQNVLAEIRFLSPPDIGHEVTQFDGLGEIESEKAVFPLISPVSGTVTAINEKLLANPKLINENPYEQGWIAEIKLRDFMDDQKSLFNGEEYFHMMKDKVDTYLSKPE